tara:strand:- start:81 stop:578 length:498 start_codon:yes stop_codon:yes gene_type:complete
MAALADATDTLYQAGTSIAVRTSGQKGKIGNVTCYVPAVGVCPEGSKNRYEASAKLATGHARLRLVLVDEKGHLIQCRPTDQGREAASDLAHKYLRDMGVGKLATFTPAQQGAIAAIVALKSSIRQMNGTIELLKSKGVPYSQVEEEVNKTKKQIDELRSSLPTL